MVRISKRSQRTDAHQHTRPQVVAREPGRRETCRRGISELRVDYGPGYRVYFLNSGEKLIILLAGGDKSSQAKDIAKAKELAKEL